MLLMFWFVKCIGVGHAVGCLAWLANGPNNLLWNHRLPYARGPMTHTHTHIKYGSGIRASLFCLVRVNVRLHENGRQVVLYALLHFWPLVHLAPSFGLPALSSLCPKSYQEHVAGLGVVKVTFYVCCEILFAHCLL